MELFYLGVNINFKFGFLRILNPLTPAGVRRIFISKKALDSGGICEQEPSQHRFQPRNEHRHEAGGDSHQEIDSA